MFPFEFASGSVLGKEHRRIGRNNQDALCIENHLDHAVAVVCDGCGSGTHSEVGAVLGSRLIAQAISERIRKGGSITLEALERARLDVLAQLRLLVNSMGGSFSATVNDYFLFTTIGVAMTLERSIFFSIGDGVIAVNDEVNRVGPFEGNAPPYLGYALIDSLRSPFTISYDGPTGAIDSFLLGTDGLNDLIDSVGKPVAGTKTSVEKLSMFWQNDAYFTNPDALNRRLRILNREVSRPDWGQMRLVTAFGILEDDTTLITGRRVPKE